LQISWRANIELSCPAASTQHKMEFRTTSTEPFGLLGDNFSDLLDFFLSSRPTRTIVGSTCISFLPVAGTLHSVNSFFP
jgi:hypothetical protein